MDVKANSSLLITTRPLKSDNIITVHSHVGTPTYESDYTNNNDDSVVNVLPLSDLTISIVLDKELVNLTNTSESDINWTIVISNDGPDKSENIHIFK